MKRLILDSENTPDIGMFFQTGYNETINYQQILKERAIICICAKWEGKDKMYRFVWRKNWDDKQLIKDFVKLLKQADEIVAHNCDRFDLPMIRARAISYGIDMSFPIVTHDTLKVARQKFKFNSNKLDYLAQYLGVGKKVDTGGLELWKEVVVSNALRKALGLPTVPQKQIDDALNKMVRYCDNDVRILEAVWYKLKPYVSHKTAVTESKIKCPECGGDTIKHRDRLLASGAKKVVLQCKDCSKYHTIPKSIYNKLNK